MTTCAQCSLEKETRGAVFNGKYGLYCFDCRADFHRQADPSSASYSRARDRESHERDLLQPWHKSGKPNTAFIREYPDSAKDMYTKEELENYG